MASHSIFSLRVVRCPACGANLPVQANVAALRCEYCDVQVEIARPGAPHSGAAAPIPPHLQPRAQPLPQPRTGDAPPPTYVAQPHYSRFAWSLLMMVPMIVVVGSGAFTAWRTSSMVREVSPPPPAPTTAVATNVAPASPPVVAATPSRTLVATTPAATPAAPAKPSAAEPPAPAKPRGPAAPKPPAGPVLSVDDARKQLEPEIRACMQAAKVHHVLAYMGNATVGPVAVLPDTRTRVDGTRVALAKTPLGRCFDAAGKSVRTSAFRSNYVRLDVRNGGVPDPLATLPARSNPSDLRDTVAGAEPELRACARKHGAEGLRTSFHLQIDGPSGAPISVRAHDGPPAFTTCSEAILRKLRFTKVQQGSYQLTYPMTL